MGRSKNAKKRLQGGLGGGGNRHRGRAQPTATQHQQLAQAPMNPVIGRKRRRQENEEDQAPPSDAPPPGSAAAAAGANASEAMASMSTVEHLTRESYARNLDKKRQLRLKQLDRAMERQEKRLRNGEPAVPAVLSHGGRLRDANIKALPGNERPLTGGARPAWQAYPELYPEVYEAQAAAEAAKPPPPDLFEKFKGKFAEHPETRPLLVTYVQHARESQLYGRLSSAVTGYQRCLEVDTADKLGARIGLVSAHLNFADVDAASEALDQQQKHNHMVGDKQAALPTDYHYGRVLVAFIDKVLLNDDEQEGGNEEGEANNEEQMEEGEKEGEDDDAEKEQQVEEGGDDDNEGVAVMAPIPPECRALIVTAIESNPWIAFAMKLHESYQQTIDPTLMDKLVNSLRADVLNSFTEDTSNDKDVYSMVNHCSMGRLPTGSVAEAMLYFHQEISCWLDADGAIAWVCQVMQEMEDEGLLKLDIDEALIEDSVISTDQGRALSKAFSLGFEHAIEEEEEQLAMNNEIRLGEEAEAEALAVLAANAEARKSAKADAAEELAAHPERAQTSGAKWRAIRPNSKTKRRKAKRRRGGKYKV